MRTFLFIATLALLLLAISGPSHADSDESLIEKTLEERKRGEDLAKMKLVLGDNNQITGNLGAGSAHRKKKKATSSSQIRGNGLAYWYNKVKASKAAATAAKRAAANLNKPENAAATSEGGDSVSLSDSQEKKRKNIMRRLALLNRKQAVAKAKAKKATKANGGAVSLNQKPQLRRRLAAIKAAFQRRKIAQIVKKHAKQAEGGTAKLDGSNGQNQGSANKQRVSSNGHSGKPPPSTWAKLYKTLKLKQQQADKIKEKITNDATMIDECAEQGEKCPASVDFLRCMVDRLKASSEGDGDEEKTAEDDDAKRTKRATDADGEATDDNSEEGEGGASGADEEASGEAKPNNKAAPYANAMLVKIWKICYLWSPADADAFKSCTKAFTSEDANDYKALGAVIKKLFVDGAANEKQDTSKFEECVDVFTDEDIEKGLVCMDDMVYLLSAGGLPKDCDDTGTLVKVVSNAAFFQKDIAAMSLIKARYFVDKKEQNVKPPGNNGQTIPLPLQNAIKKMMRRRRQKDGVKRLEDE